MTESCMQMNNNNPIKHPSTEVAEKMSNQQLIRVQGWESVFYGVLRFSGNPKDSKIRFTKNTKIPHRSNNKDTWSLRFQGICLFQWVLLMVEKHSQLVKIYKDSTIVCVPLLFKTLGDNN